MKQYEIDRLIYRLRDNMISLNAWIEHWEQDAACNLACTPGSLARAKFRVTNSLEILDEAQRPEDLTIIPGDTIKSEAEAAADLYLKWF